MEQFSRRNNHTLFSIGFVLLLCMIFLKYSVQIDFSEYILLAIFICTAFISDRNELIALSVCCIPFISSFHYIYAILVCEILLIYKLKNEIRIKAEVVILIILIVWELLHCFTLGAVIKDGMTFILPYALCFIIMFSNVERVDYLFVMRVLAIATLWMCLVLLTKLFINADFNIGNAFYEMDRLGIVDESEMTRGTFNPNTLGYFCILSATGLLQAIVSGNKIRSDIPILVLLIVCGFLTASRTYIICLIVLIVLILFVQRGSLKKKATFIIGLVALAGIVIILVNVFFPETFGNLFDRFKLDDVSGGRSDLFMEYNRFIMSSGDQLFWGTGLSAERIKLDEYFGMYNAQTPHNGIQEVLVVWGVPGLVLFIVYLSIIILSARRINTNQQLINYIPLILLLTKVQAGQMVTAFYTMLMFPLAFLSLCYAFQEK